MTAEEEEGMAQASDNLIPVLYLPSSVVPNLLSRKEEAGLTAYLSSILRTRLRAAAPAPRARAAYATLGAARHRAKKNTRRILLAYPRIYAT